MNRSVLKKGVSLVAFAAAIQCVAVPPGYQQFGYVKDDTPVVTNAELAMEAAIERIRLEAEKTEGRVDEKITNTKEELAQRIVASTNDLPVMIESATNALNACVRGEIDEALQSANGHADIAAENARAESKAYADDAVSNAMTGVGASLSNVWEGAVAMTNALNAALRDKGDVVVYRLSGVGDEWTWTSENEELAGVLNRNKEAYFFYSEGDGDWLWTTADIGDWMPSKWPRDFPPVPAKDASFIIAGFEKWDHGHVVGTAEARATRKTALVETADRLATTNDLNEAIGDVANAVRTNTALLGQHCIQTNNPHSVTADQIGAYPRESADERFRGISDFYTYPILELGDFEWTSPDRDFEAEMKARNAFPRLDYAEGVYREYFFDMEYHGRWVNGFGSCSTNDLEMQLIVWSYEPIYDDDGNWIEDSYEEYVIEGRRKVLRVDLEHPNGKIVCANSFPYGRIAKFTSDGKIVAAAGSSDSSSGDYRSPNDNISHTTYGYGEWVSDNYTGRSSLVWNEDKGAWMYTCPERNYFNYETSLRGKYYYSVGIYGDFMKRPHSSTMGQPFVTLDCVLDLHQKATNAAATVVAGHVAKRNNPHGVTAAQVGAYTKSEVDSLLPKNAAQWSKDIYGGITAFSVGGENVRFGEWAFANGCAVKATGLYAHAEGNGTSATASYSLASGLASVASANYSHAEGTHTEALANGSHTDGNRARANSVYAYVWQGHNNIMTDPSWYVSHGAGTFNVNPVGGLDGFYIGEQNLTTILANAGRMTSASAKTGVVEPVVKRMLEEALSKLDAETATAKDVIQALLEMCEED